VAPVSSIGTYAAPTARTAGAGLTIAAIILGLFVLAAAVSAERKDVTQGFDEVAHASYVAHMQHTGLAWPALQQMRMLDPHTFQFTGEANYLNHPPPFYALLAAIGPVLEGRPQALLAHRILDIALVALGFAALLALGLAARFPRHEFYAYAVPLACIPVLVPLAGSINNDNLAFMGGAIATLAGWQLVATGRGWWLSLALAGVVVAAWAKLTGLTLAGGMIAVILAWLAWRGRLPWRWALAAAIALAIAAAPYLIFIAQYGSPTPDTPAQAALIADGARAAGWTDLPRKSFLAYAAYFTFAFVIDWMPALTPRSAFNYAMLAIPVAALGGACAGVVLSLRRIRQRRDSALDVVVAAGACALAATFALHVTYSYSRHVATGWLMDAYPRYYLPLAAIVPLAGLSLVAAAEHPRTRAALLGFLMAGPVVFRLLGAPLG
jgi:hypothetical protein